MSYTITIQADNSDVATTVRIDDSGTTPRVTEVSVRASAGLSTSQLPLVDIDSLLRGLSLAATGARAARSPAAVAPAEKAAKKASGAPAKSTLSATRKRATTAANVAPATAGPAKVAKTARPRKAEAQSRIYRRTPDDLAATFARTASISAVARHYGVPRHTAQGWIARLRQFQG